MCGSYPLDLGDGAFFAPAGTTETRALSADRLKVDGNMFCGVDEGGQRFTAEGEVRLAGAHIGGQLAFVGAQLKGSPIALNLYGAEVASSVWLLLHNRPQEGMVDLRLARLGVIHDRAYSEPVRPWLKPYLERAKWPEWLRRLLTRPTRPATALGGARTRA